MQRKPWTITMKDDNTADILLYGFIFDSCASDFVKQLNELSAKAAVINIRINSGGGDVFDGFAIYNAIKQCKAEVNTYVDGIAGSMASIVSQAGKKRYISQVGRIMTHKPSAWGGGNSENLRENADMLDSIESMMCNILSATTGKTKEECKSLFLNGKDNWFDAEQAKANGLVDEIYDAEPIEMPKEASTEEKVWKGYDELRFAAVINQIQNSNMKNVTLTAAVIAALKLNDNADQAAFEAKLADVTAKAAAHDMMKTEKEAAETALANFKKDADKKELDGLLTAAVNDKKMTVEQKAIYAKQFAGNLEGLKEIVATLKPYESKVQAEVTDKTDEQQEQELAAEWRRRDKDGSLEKVKAQNFEHYKDMFKARFGKEYTA